jgi:hypothetical protein
VPQRQVGEVVLIFSEILHSAFFFQVRRILDGLASSWLLQPVLLHQMTERAIGDAQQVSSLGLHAATLIE